MFKSGFFALLGGSVALLCLYGIYLGSAALLSVATPFVAGGVCALLLDPFVARLERLPKITKGSRSIAVGLVSFGFLAVFIGLIVLLVPVLVGQIRTLIEWITSDGPREFQNATDQWLTEHRSLGPVALPKSINDIVSQYSEQVTSGIRRYGSGLANGFIAGVGNLLQLVLIPIVTFTLLNDLPRLRARLIFLVPEQHRQGLVESLVAVGSVFANYVRGMLQVSMLYGSIATLLLFLLSLFLPEVRGYGLLIGLVAGVLYAVPYIGLAGTMLLTVSLGLIGHIPPFWIGTEIALLFALNLVFDNAVTPKIVGGGVGLHPLLAMLSLLLGASLFGLIGMLIGVPIAGSIQLILLKRFPRLAVPTSDEVHALSQHLSHNQVTTVSLVPDHELGQ